MRGTRYLTKRGNTYIFQMQIPAHLNPLARLGPLRKSLGPIGQKAAQAAADILAGQARSEFAVNKIPVIHKDSISSLEMLLPREFRIDEPGGMGETLTPEERKVLYRPLQAAITALLKHKVKLRRSGADGIDGSPRSIRVDDPLYRKIFDGLAAIGLDRVRGSGNLTRLFGADTETILIRAFLEPAFGAELFGLPCAGCRSALTRTEARPDHEDAGSEGGAKAGDRSAEASRRRGL